MVPHQLKNSSLKSTNSPSTGSVLSEAPETTISTVQAANKPYPPVTAKNEVTDGEKDKDERDLMTLELKDGTSYQGWSFGAQKSVSGEMVFQTGRKSESLTLRT